MADSHPDPFRLSKVVGYYAKRRDEGNPITFDQMIDLANPSITYEWIDIITERLAEVEKRPDIQPEDKDNFRKAATKMLGILSELKRTEAHHDGER